MAKLQAKQLIVSCALFCLKIQVITR